MTTKTMPMQILGLDLLRFLAALMVAVYHLAFWRNGGGTLPGHPGVADFTWFGWVGVEIFFVISGFVISYTTSGATPFSFFRSRVMRLFPGIFIAATLAAAFLIYAGKAPVATIVDTYARTLVLWPYGPWLDIVYWTLGIEIVFYAIPFVLICMGAQRFFVTVLLTIGAISGGFWLGALLVNNLPALAGGALQAQILKLVVGGRALQLLLLHHGVFFALGVLFFSIHTKGFSIARGMLLIAFLIAGATEITTRSQQYAHMPALVPLAVWLFSLLMLAACISWNQLMLDNYPLLATPMRKLGLLSYALYLNHNTNGMLFQHAMQAAGFSPFAAFVASLAGVIAIAACIAFDFEVLVQRYFKMAFVQLEILMRGMPGCAFMFRCMPSAA